MRIAADNHETDIREPRGCCWPFSSPRHRPLLAAASLSIYLNNKMASIISSNESNNEVPAAAVVRLLGFVMDMFKEQQQWQHKEHQQPSDWLTNINNRSTSGVTVDQVQVVDAADADATASITTDELQLLMPVWAYQTAAAYLIFICVLGLFMNIVVVLVIISDPQRMTPLNWMLLNLACSDGTIAGFGTTISTAAALQFGWPFSDELCVAYAMIMSTAGIGSITTLTALALWRCQLVVYCPANRSGAFAQHHHSGGGGGSAKLGRVQAAVLLSLIWAYSLAVTCPPLFGWGRYDREAAHISCSVNWESKMANNRSYILYMFAFGLLVPMVVIVSSYVSILRVVKKTGKFKRSTLIQQSTTQQQPNEQRITPDLQQQEEVKSQPNLNNNQHQQPARTSSSRSNSDAAEKRVTVMVACMVGAFLAAWTPYSILALFETFIGDAAADHSGSGGAAGAGRNMSSSSFISSSSLDGQTNAEEEKGTFLLHYVGAISPAFATIPSLFAKTSAVLNPLIYGLLNTRFRSAWEKFTNRFLRRRRHRRRHRNSKDLAVNISAGLSAVKQNRKRQVWQYLSCNTGGSSTSLKQSAAAVHLSMKEFVSSESQSAYVMVMANTVGQQQVVCVRHQGDDEDQRRRPKNPAMTSGSSIMSNPESSATQEQTIQMKCSRNRRQLSVQQLEEPPASAQEQKAVTTTNKLVVVRMISESTSCTNGCDQNVVTTTTTLEEQVSVFSADASAGSDIRIKPRSPHLT